MAPLADEIIGGIQFGSLCEKYAVIEADEKFAMNKNVVLQRSDQDIYAKGTLLRIRITPYVFKDSVTDRIVFSYHRLNAEGGLLIRLLGISQTNSPLTFESSCYPEDIDSFKKKFNIKVIN